MAGIGRDSPSSSPDSASLEDSQGRYDPPLCNELYILMLKHMIATSTQKLLDQFMKVENLATHLVCPSAPSWTNPTSSQYVLLAMEKRKLVPPRREYTRMCSVSCIYRIYTVPGMVTSTSTQQNPVQSFLSYTSMDSRSPKGPSTVPWMIRKLLHCLRRFTGFDPCCASVHSISLLVATATKFASSKTSRISTKI